VFDEARGRAWITHNIEEVGNFETFLPKLYAVEGSVETTDMQANQAGELSTRMPDRELSKSD
jgi:hypothetical protein